MVDPNIKQIKLVSSEPIQEGGKSRKRSKKKLELPTSITKEGGGSTSPGTMTQLASTRVAAAENPVEPVGMNSSLTQKGTPTASLTQTAGAASNPVKVILGELKKKPKVVLAAAKTKVVPQTRKVKAARKVRVSMVALSRKIGKAKDIRTKASDDKIDEVKKALQKAGLIKAESKAPETMLRQMYADFMMLKKRAL
jgi:hypothetical protein